MRNLFFCVLLFSVFISALNVVVAQHQSRKVFVEIQSLEKKRDGLNEEWTRLLLEQSTWATDGRVESISRNQLKMNIPGDDAQLVLK